MFNHKMFCEAFGACKQIYYLTEVHVNLIAKQLGVLAIDVIDYIDANPTLVQTSMRYMNSGYPQNPDKNIFFGMSVTGVTNIPFLTTESVVKEGADGCEVTISLLSGVFDASTSTSNFIVDAGTTGLTLSAVSNGTTSKKLTFTGEVKRGTLSIQAKESVVPGTVDSDILYIDVAELNYSLESMKAIAVDILALEAAILELTPEPEPEA